MVETKKALLQIIGMQECFLGDKDERKKNTVGIRKCRRGEMFMSNIKSLLDKARELDMTVIHQYATSIRSPHEKIEKPFVEDPSMGPIIDELAPIDRLREHIVSRIGPDLFLHTHEHGGPVVDSILRRLKDVNTVIVTGAGTYISVMYAVEGYCNRGYRVIVPMDGVLCPEEENQAMTLHLMSICNPNYPATITLSNMITFI